MFFFQFVLAICSFFHFDENFRINFSTYIKKLLNFVLYLWINLERIYIHTIMRFTIPDHGISLHLFTFTLMSLGYALYFHIVFEIYSWWSCFLGVIIFFNFYVLVFILEDQMKLILYIELVSRDIQFTFKFKWFECRLLLFGFVLPFSVCTTKSPENNDSFISDFLFFWLLFLIPYLVTPSTVVSKCGNSG